MLIMCKKVQRVLSYSFCMVQSVQMKETKISYYHDNGHFWSFNVEYVHWTGLLILKIIWEKQSSYLRHLELSEGQLLTFAESKPSKIFQVWNCISLCFPYPFTGEYLPIKFIFRTRETQAILPKINYPEKKHTMAEFFFLVVTLRF